MTLNRSVAVARTSGPERALEIIDTLAETLGNYLYYHTTRAALLAEAGRKREAGEAYERALALGPTRAEAEYLSAKLASL